MHNNDAAFLSNSDVYYSLVLLRRLLSLPLTACGFLSLQFLREGPQEAHKMLVPVGCSYTPKITLQKFPIREGQNEIQISTHTINKQLASSNKPKRNKMHFYEAKLSFSFFYF